MSTLYNSLVNNTINFDCFNSSQFHLLALRTRSIPRFQLGQSRFALQIVFFILSQHLLFRHQSFEPGIHDNNKLACPFPFLQHFIQSFVLHIFLYIHPGGNTARACLKKAFLHFKSFSSFYHSFRQFCFNHLFHHFFFLLN